MTLGEFLGAVAAALGVVLGLCTLGGLLVRYALLPWLEQHLVTPVREVNHQVSVNGHISRVPTLLDRVDNAAGLARELRVEVDTLVGGQEALGRMLDGHLDRSASEWGRMWEAIRELRSATHPQLAPPPGEEDPP